MNTQSRFPPPCFLRGTSRWRSCLQVSVRIFLVLLHTRPLHCADKHSPLLMDIFLVSSLALSVKSERQSRAVGFPSFGIPARIGLQQWEFLSHRSNARIFASFCLIPLQRDHTVSHCRQPWRTVVVSPPSPAERIAKLLDSCQSDRWEMVSQTSFHLHFFSWDLSGDIFSPLF